MYYTPQQPPSSVPPAQQQLSPTTFQLYQAQPEAVTTLVPPPQQQSIISYPSLFTVATDAPPLALHDVSAINNNNSVFDAPPKNRNAALVTRGDDDNDSALQPLTRHNDDADTVAVLVENPAMRRGPLLLANIGERINHAYPVALVHWTVSLLGALVYALALVRLYELDV